MGFTPKSSLNDKKYRYVQSVKTEAPPDNKKNEIKSSSQEKENELFEFTSKPFLTSFERELTNNGATQVFKTERVFKEDTTRCDSEI